MAGTMVFGAPVENNDSYTRSRSIEITAACTGDASDGTVPTTAIPLDLRGMFLYSLETVPGSGDAAPSAVYDVTVVNSRSTDLLQGTGEDRSVTVKEIAYPSSAPASIMGACSLTCGSLGASNTATLTLNFRR